MTKTRLALCAASIIGVILIGLAANAGFGAAADRAVVESLALRQDQSSPALIALMQAISWIGGGPARTLLVGLIALALWRLHGGMAAVAMASCSFVSNELSGFFKMEFGRPRPHLAPHLDNIGTSLSYPSGHATSAAAVYLLLALLAPARHRKLALALGLGLTFLTGLSRIMLGVHYPSDVIGGWLLGGAFALLGAQLVDRPAAPKP